jgi:hypothetical protein
MAQAGYKGKRVEVEIHTDTYKIRGMLFIPLAGEGGYRSATGPRSEMGRTVSRRQQKRGYDGPGD